MKVAIIGYGRMGKAIESILLERNHEVVLKASEPNYNLEKLAEADVAIEFTQPESAVKNILNCFNAKTPVVTGTTGWHDQYDEVSRACVEQNGGLIFASNFSLGVNLFFAINKKVAQLLGKYPSYDASIEEIHHTKKKDKPSGTAITIAEQMLEHLPQKTNWKLDDPSSKANFNISISALRQPDVLGTHAVRYQSEIDDIEIKHTAHNRKGFALGAVLAAEFLAHKTGIYNMNDVLNINNL